MKRSARLHFTTSCSAGWLTPNLAAAAIEDDLNRIARKYLESSWRTGHPVTADDYFAPYLKDLISILRSKNVEPYDERMDSLKTKQEIIDDILSQQEFERKQFRRKQNTQNLREIRTRHRSMALREKQEARNR